jgi:hypothetical protein
MHSPSAPHPGSSQAASHPPVPPSLQCVSHLAGNSHQLLFPAWSNQLCLWALVSWSVQARGLHGGDQIAGNSMFSTLPQLVFPRAPRPASQPSCLPLAPLALHAHGLTSVQEQRSGQGSAAGKELAAALEHRAGSSGVKEEGQMENLYSPVWARSPKTFCSCFAAAAVSPALTLCCAVFCLARPL